MKGSDVMAVTNIGTAIKSRDEKIKQLQAELENFRRIASKCLGLYSQTGTGLPCITSKSGVQCCDIFVAVGEFKQVLKG